MISIKNMNPFVKMTSHFYDDNFKTTKLPNPEVSELKIIPYFIHLSNTDISVKGFEMERCCDAYRHFFLSSKSTVDLRTCVKAYWIEYCKNKLHVVTEPCESIVHSLKNTEPIIDNIYILHLPPIPIACTNFEFDSIKVMVETYNHVSLIEDVELICTAEFYTNTDRINLSRIPVYISVFMDLESEIISLNKGLNTICMNHGRKICDIVIKSDTPLSGIGIYTIGKPNIIDAKYYSHIIPYQRGMILTDNTYVVPVDCVPSRIMNCELLIEIDEPCEIRIIYLFKNCFMISNGLLSQKFIK